MILGILDTLKVGAGFVVGAVLFYQIGHWTGAAAGRAQLKAEIAETALRTEQERVKDDRVLSDLSDDELCRRHLGPRGLQDACRELRRLP